ncbi:MAG TPA: glycosyltransferase family 4 protein [bacterium]|nr:glycosyltransferase family 4 protein [bacterium]
MNAALPRILLVNNTSSLSAGTTRSLLLILRYLRHKYSFSVAAVPDSDGLPGALLELEVPFHRLGFLPFASFRRLTGLMGKQKYDLVYANNLGTVTRDSFWAARLTGRPFIWHIREPLIYRRFCWTVKYSDAVAANSQSTAERVTSMAGYRSPVVIPNGVDLAEFGTDRVKARETLLKELGWPADSCVILNLGMLCQRKNQLDAIAVTRLVTERCPEARLVCLGAPQEAGYPERLWERIHHCGLRGKVRLLGAKPNPPYYLNASDLLLHTSVDEPQGRVVLEAMAAELPVVAYSVGGIPEAVVEGETGLLAPVGDTAAAAEAACRLIENPELRHRMGKAGRARVVQHFTAEETARKVDGVIQSVLAKQVRFRTEGP